MGATNYRDLIAWQKAMDFVVTVYRVSDGFPSKEQYGLTSQLCRSAVSAPSNIAEGEGRGSDADFIRFLYIAHGSLREAETQLLIAKRLGYVPPESVDDAMNLAAEVGRLIQGLINSLKRRLDP